ncbi:MAG TPA: winged helix DNA-binding domain-containing protein [Gaiellaceae bacterium]|nr:winged helix DNA-binding domain-containing protein [Gaiellaceae bacterium]
MAPATLTVRDRNRALLARQLLLERSKATLVRALERVGGIQAQYAPSSYIGLWSRLAGFELADLTRALERRRAVQGTLLRSTIHLVSAGDYWAFALGSRAARQEAWLRFDKKRLSRADLESAAGEVRRTLAGRIAGRDELLELARRRDPERPTHLWNGLAAWVDLVRAPPSGTWERRRADLYALADDWVGAPSLTPAEGAEILLRRYLGGFGPAGLADAANWAGMPVAELEPAVDRLRLRRLRDEDGRQLLDLPRAPLPGGDAPAPPRFLPTWDATLLVHARATQILPEEYRPLVFSTKTPHSTPTFLVDGAVAGKWQVERSRKKATLVLEPFERLPAAARRELQDEGEGLVRLVEPDAETHAVR